MKKRKILLGLALASLFTFSLASCGEDKPAEQTPTVDGGSGTGTDGGSGSSTDGGSGQSGDTTPTTQQYTVKFKNGTTELTALEQKVDKNGKVTKPARTNLPTQSGKRFDFWSADGGVTAYNFDEAVTGDVTLTAVFADTNEYDTLAASANKVVAVDFYDEVVEKVDASSFDSSTAKVTTTDAANKVTNDGKYYIAKNNLNVDFGDKKITSSGVLTAYFEVSFGAIKNGEAFFQVDGTSAAKENSEVFGIRVSSTDGMKGNFAYRLDGGVDTNLGSGPTTTGLYAFKVVLDTAEGTGTIELNGTKVADVTGLNISAIRGLKFTAKNDETSKKTVDNIAATFEAKAADPVVTAKSEALAMIDEYKADAVYTAYSNVLKTYINKALEEFKTSIGSADSVTAVSTIKENITAFIGYDKFTVAVTPCTAANVAVVSVDPAYICVISNYTQASDISSQLEAVKFAGYDVSGIYSDEALTTDAVVADVVKGAELYAKVAEKVFGSETITFTTTGDITGNTEIGSYITVEATSSAKWTIDANEKTYKDIDGTSQTAATRIKSNGARDNMALDLTSLAGKTVTLEIYAITGSNGATRNVTIKDSTKTTTVAGPLASRDSSAKDGSTNEVYNGENPLVFTLTGGSKYYICTDAAINFVAINVIVSNA